MLVGVLQGSCRESLPAKDRAFLALLLLVVVRWRIMSCRSPPRFWTLSTLKLCQLSRDKGSLWSNERAMRCLSSKQVLALSHQEAADGEYRERGCGPGVIQPGNHTELQLAGSYCYRYSPSNACKCHVVSFQGHQCG